MKLNENVRSRHLCRVAHRPGPRLLGELISELAASSGTEDEVMRALESYARVADKIKTLSASDWPKGPTICATIEKAQSK